MDGLRDGGIAWLDAVARNPETTRIDLLVAIAMLRDGCAGGVTGGCDDCGEVHELSRDVVNGSVTGLTVRGYIEESVRLPCDCGECSGEYILKLTIPAP